MQELACVGADLCRSWLASEEGVTFNITVACDTAFAGKPRSYRDRPVVTQLLYRSMIALTACVLTLEASLRACSILFR